MRYNKLILVDRVSNLEDMERVVYGVLETYYEKWMTVKTGKDEILRKLDIE